MASLTPSPKMQFFDANGNPLSGGKLYTYTAGGTSTPQATYTDYGGGTPNANPVILDSRGEASVWCGSSMYYWVLKDSNDVQIWTADNIGGPDVATLTAIAASGGSALMGYLPAGSGAVATTVQAKLREFVSVKDFGAVGDGVTDDTAAIQAAINAVNVAGGGYVYLPTGTYLANNIELKSGVYIVGASTTGTVVINASADNHCFYSTAAGGVDDWGLENLTIKNTDASCEDGIYVDPSSGTARRWHLRNLRVEGGNNAIRLINVYLGTAENIDILIGSGGRLVKGLVIGDVTNSTNANVFNEVWVTSASSHGIHIVKGSTNVFNNPTVQSCTGVGILADTGSASNSFISPYFEANSGTCDIKLAGGGNTVNAPYHAGVATKPTNTIILNGASEEVYNPYLPNVVTPAILVDTSASKCKIFGGWYQNGVTTQITDNGTATQITATEWVKTFTPGITFSTPGDLSVSYATAEGRYNRVGKRCVGTIYIDTSAFTHTTASGTFRINGLPFPCSSSNNAHGGSVTGWQGITKANYTQLGVVGRASNTEFNVFLSGSGQNLFQVTTAEVPTGGTVKLRINFDYEIASGS